MANGLSKIHSIGMLMKEDAESITITTSITDTHDGADPLTIPKSWISGRKQIGTVTV